MLGRPFERLCARRLVGVERATFSALSAASATEGIIVWAPTAMPIHGADAVAGVEVLLGLTSGGSGSRDVSEDRLDALEMLAAEQGRMLEELSDVIASQQ